VNTYGAGEAVVLSFLAGADLLLQPVDPAVAVRAMEQAVSSGRIGHDRLEESVRRVLALKAELGLFARRQVSLDSVPVVVGAESFRQTARDVTARSLVLARDDAGAVARLRQKATAVSLISLADERNVTLGRTLANELRAGGTADPRATTRRVR
jgi:beta-glucosidase-like glycosyl hydrolase